jgi:pimeloyl-ACP methyl ester carboxylesterase
VDHRRAGGGLLAGPERERAVRAGRGRADLGAGVWAPRARDLAAGAGETPPVDIESFRPSRLAGLVLRVLDELGLGHAIFAGFSWGGFVGCRLAARAPERLSALVLLEAGHVDLGAPGSLADWIDVARGIEPALPDREAAGAAIWGIVREPPSETWPALARLPAPILMLTGGDAAEAFSRAVPRAEVRVLPGTGHELLKDATAEATRTIGTWIAQQKPLRYAS